MTCEWICEFAKITSNDEARKYENHTWFCEHHCQNFNQPCNNKCPSSRLNVCKEKCTFLTESFKKISLEGAIKCPNTCDTSLEYLSCDNGCRDSEYISDGDTWICNETCQSLSEPCNGKCPGNMNLNCQGRCEKFKKRTQYWCNEECLNITVPCEGYCEEFEDDETGSWEKNNCYGKCQSPLIPCKGVCHPDAFLNCTGFCTFLLPYDKDYKWACGNNCINISSPCNGKCAHKSQSLSCNGLCEKKRTAYICDRKCVSIDFPCEGTCQEKCIFDDILGCSEQYDCEGICQPMKLPCNQKCPIGFFINCHKFCEFFKYPNYVRDFGRYYLEKELSNFKWHCNSSCFSGLESCNGTCISPTLKANCKGECEAVPTFYECDSHCQPVEIPCNGFCHDGFSLNFDGRCFLVGKTCEMGLRYDCVTGVCTDIPLNIVCDGKCQSITETCNGSCPLEDQILTCELKCVWEIFHVDNFYHCNNQCISLKEPCKEKCPKPRIACKGQCYRSNVVFECDGKCTADNKKCKDCETAYVRHFDQKEKMTNCPMESHCTIPELICNDFFSFNFEGCSRGLEVSKRVCENPAQHNLSNICKNRNLESCSGHRPLQCIEASRKCNNFIDCIDRSDESGCILELEKVIDYSIFKDCNASYKSYLGYKNQPGFLCGNFCIPSTVLCRNTITEDGQSHLAKLSACPKLLKEVNSKQLCQNYTFWSNKPCYGDFNRCSGNFPGQCFSKIHCGFPVSIVFQEC